MNALFTRATVLFAAIAAPIALMAAQNDKEKTPLRISHGEEVAISKYLVNGKFTIFDFYSDYCPPCRALKPTLERIHAERDDVALVVVDINRPDTKGIDWSSPVAVQYSLHSIPHLVIYNPSGKVVAEDSDDSAAAQEYIEQHWSK